MARSDGQFIALAVREARRSRSEDARPHPLVGVVVVQRDRILASSCRGDLDPGEHAEYGVLERKLATDTLAGATVYTTLEPCTDRNHPKIPCAERLIERRVARVVIGMLDPDQRICGRGILRLRRAGIAVDLFPPAEMAELEELNREFIRDREAAREALVLPGLREAGITAFYPSRDHYARFRKDAATIDRYVEKAEVSAVLVSVNLMTGIPFDDLCACLDRKLRAPASQFHATVSLLDPTQADLMSVMGSVLNLDATDLAQAVCRAIRQLSQFRGSLSADAARRLDVRVHRALPSSSAILLDHRQANGRIQLETKPYKSGVRRSFAFEVKRVDAGGLYDVLASSYEALLADGIAVVGVPVEPADTCEPGPPEERDRI